MANIIRSQEWGRSLEPTYTQSLGAACPHNLPPNNSLMLLPTLNLSDKHSLVFLHCPLAFVTSSVSTTWRKKKKNIYPNRCILFNYRCNMLRQVSNLKSLLDLYLRSSMNFSSWLSTVLLKIKVTSTASVQVKLDLEHSRAAIQLSNRIYQVLGLEYIQGDPSITVSWQKESGIWSQKTRAAAVISIDHRNLGQLCLSILSFL